MAPDKRLPWAPDRGNPVAAYVLLLVVAVAVAGLSTLLGVPGVRVTGALVGALGTGFAIAGLVLEPPESSGRGVRDLGVATIGVAFVFTVLVARPFNPWVATIGAVAGIVGVLLGLHFPERAARVDSASELDKPAPDHRSATVGPPAERAGSNAVVPEYDPLAAARSYAALAAVFGGFTLTAIVLLIQLLIPAEPGGAPRFGGEVTSGIRAVGSSFLVAFSGCIISAFVMTVACAEPERDAPRAHFMLLLGGVSLATSVLLTFWSIASLVALLGFADPSWLPYGFFVALSVLTGLFLTGTALDVLLLSGYHKDSGPRRGDFLGLFSCGIVVGAISFFAWPQWADRNAQLLAAEVLAAIVVVAAAGIAVLVSTFRRSDYRFVRQKTLSRAGRLPSLIAVYALAALPSVVAGALTAIRF